MSKNIKLKTLSFKQKAFRKFADTEITFADRITLIAGHNGVGKTTILGLLAGTFGLTDTSFKTYTEELFSKSIENILHIDLAEVGQHTGDARENPKITANIDGETIEKRCSLTTRGDKNKNTRRARLVARNTSPEFDNLVGEASKVSLPTLFLGVKRLITIGESEENSVSITPLQEMCPDDKRFIKEFVSNIMSGSPLTDDISYQTITKHEKRSAQPKYENFSEFSISLGQDSLGTIATALASFQKLKRDMGEDYPGGLLLIDEIDVGFHPRTIRKLASGLKNAAKKLNLQIVATTHSPVLIEEIFTSSEQDKVIYFFDSNHPHIKDNISLQDIQNDLELRLTEKVEKKDIHVYFEDEEGKEFFDAIFPARSRTAATSNLNVKLHLIPLHVGGDNLLKFPKTDAHFRQRVIVVDGDTTIHRRNNIYKNVVRLPIPTNTQITNASPERLIKDFLAVLVNDRVLLKKLPNNITSDYINDVLLDSHTTNNRTSAKNWWRKNFKNLKDWKIIKLWAESYPEEVEVFKNNFVIALKNALKNTGQTKQKQIK
ncbi:ATP/GTP-binding protein [Pelistega sp. MC2]|uniref:AAA family ATPase n=1 Tax=Pelistega sp. MC2 TaxID=1720297 RepID=UPI0008D9C3CA|nr:AAA family ATPase [Pelistega sp. MC2]